MIPNNRYRKTLGDEGEKLVEHYLVKQGWRIMARKFRVRGGELDLVAYHPAKAVLAFVEVKVRMSEEFGEAVEQCTSKKILRMRLTGREFLLRNAEALKERNCFFKRIRYDFCAVTRTVPKHGWKLKYFESIA